MNLFAFPFMPPLWSVEGQDVDLLMVLIHLVMLILFVGWAVFFVVALMRFRKSRHPKVTGDFQTSPAVSASVEAGVAGIELLLLFGFSIPFWASHMAQVPQGSGVFRVKVTAQQFNWIIHYPGPDGKFGKTSREFLKENAIGLDPNDPNGKDDVTTINQLHIPVGRPVTIELQSRDVIHSFGLPVMRVMQDAIPGMTTRVGFTPVKTGESEIVCHQLCGMGHYQMRGFLVVEPQEQFDQWMKDVGPVQGSFWET